jgi:hypothetical protein
VARRAHAAIRTSSRKAAAFAALLLLVEAVGKRGVTSGRVGSVVVVGAGVIGGDREPVFLWFLSIEPGEARVIPSAAC